MTDTQHWCNADGDPLCGYTLADPGEHVGIVTRVRDYYEEQGLFCGVCAKILDEEARYRRGSWWAYCVFHNCVVHPVLPLADALEEWGGTLGKRVASGVFWLHDHSAPKGGG